MGKGVFSLLILLLCFSVTSTGIINNYVGYFESELVGVVLTSLICFCILVRKGKFDKIDLLFVFLSLYAFGVSLIYLGKGVIEEKNLFGMYLYVLPMVIFLCRDAEIIKKYANRYLMGIFFFLILSSIYSIFQHQLKLNWIPWDSWRATGFMRSTLNYSGLVTLCFFPLMLLRMNRVIKFIGLAVILIGLQFSQSRGAMISIIFPYLLVSLVTIGKIKLPLRKMLGYMVGFYVVAGVLLYVFAFSDLGNAIVDRLSTITDFSGDASNVGRQESWSMALQMIATNPFGHGVGQVGSTISYFVENVIDIESFILSILYDIGIVGILYFVIPFKWAFKSVRVYAKQHKKVMAMFLICILIQASVQATYITPSLLVVFWLNMIFSVGYLRQQHGFVEALESVSVAERKIMVS